MRVSIRVRLSVLFGAGMAAVLVGLGTFTYLRLEADLLASVDLGLRSRAQVVADAVGSAREHDVITSRGRLIDPDEAFAQTLDASGAIVDASSAVSDEPLLSATDVASVSGPTFLRRDASGFDDPVRLLAVSAQRAGEPVVVVVGANLGDLRDALDRLLAVMATVGPAALTVTVAAGWLLATAALRPVEAIRREAEAISASEPDRRLPEPPTADELARLTATLNSMLDRLHLALERERRFVDDASHELRTPLATLRAEIDLALARERTAPELVASLRSAQDDVRRLQRLAEDLLVLARARGGLLPVRREPTPLPELVARSVRAVAGQAQRAGVHVATQAAEGAVNLDPDRVQQALCNLLDNAIRHTPRKGAIDVSATRGEGRVQFVVQDTGPGFSPDLLPRAFEPFARGPADARTEDGAGLGLAIVRAIAESHGGSAVAENTPAGARLTLTLRT